MAISLVHCEKKNRKQIFKSEVELPAPPPTVPEISNGPQLYDQLSYVAMNLAATVENLTVNNVGSATLMNIIISAIPSGVEDVSMLDVDNAITTNTSSGPKFTLGLTATSDLYQAMLYCSNKYK